MRINEIANWRRTRLRASGILLACGSTLVAPVATATDDLCGATVFADLTLDHDLNCVGHGLIVGADGITLKLNGHTIRGSGTAVGSGFGITVIGRTNVSVAGGTVTNFEAGLRVMNSSDVVIKGNEILANGDGVDFAAGSVGNTVKENRFQDNRVRAIMMRAGVTDNVIKENTFAANRVGILVFAGVDNTIKENSLSASGLAGIRINVLATGNLIIENEISLNPAGVEFLLTPTGSAIGNALIENRITSNACGLKGPTDGNTFNENVFDANVVESCQ